MSAPNKQPALLPAKEQESRPQPPVKTRPARSTRRQQPAPEEKPKHSGAAGGTPEEN